MITPQITVVHIGPSDEEQDVMSKIAVLEWYAQVVSAGFRHRIYTMDDCVVMADTQLELTSEDAKEVCEEYFVIQTGNVTLPSGLIVRIMNYYEIQERTRLLRR